MQAQFENIKMYSDFIQNRIQIEIFENPDQYDEDIEFWYEQYIAIEIALENMMNELGIKKHPALDVLVANKVNVCIKIIEQKRNGNMTFEEFLELIRVREWGEINTTWYGYCIYCFNSRIATKCRDVTRKSDKHATIKRTHNKIYILDFDALNSYLKGYVGDQLEKSKNECLKIPKSALEDFNQYSNDFHIQYLGYYIIHNIAKERENEEKEKEIDEIIDFLF